MAEVDPLMLGGEGGPRIDKVEAQFYRKGKCAICSGSVERLKTFSDTTLGGCQIQADAWSQTPLKHKRCE